jgi:hypothetical protein
MEQLTLGARHETLDAGTQLCQAMSDGTTAGAMDVLTRTTMVMLLTAWLVSPGLGDLSDVIGRKPVLVLLRVGRLMNALAAMVTIQLAQTNQLDPNMVQVIMCVSSPPSSHCVSSPHAPAPSPAFPPRFSGLLSRWDVLLPYRARRFHRTRCSSESPRRSRRGAACVSLWAQREPALRVCAVSDTTSWLYVDHNTTAAVARTVLIPTLRTTNRYTTFVLAGICEVEVTAHTYFAMVTDLYTQQQRAGQIGRLSAAMGVSVTVAQLMDGAVLDFITPIQVSFHLMRDDVG